jgi:tRNA A22 N-methylase
VSIDPEKPCPPNRSELTAYKDSDVSVGTMLDIGGSHGYFSVVLCRKHKGMRSVILDLPKAITQAAPILAAERMEDRVVQDARR